jgi:hypothetical protein
MALKEMPFPEILKDHYGTDVVSVETLSADLDIWSDWVNSSEDHPEVDFDDLGLRIQAACTYLIWKEGKRPLPSEPRCDIPTGDYYAR